MTNWVQLTRLFANKKAIIVLQAKHQSESELERIKNSVKIELRELERTRDSEQKKVESVRKNVLAEEQRLKQLKSDVADYRGQIQALERELRQKAAIQNPPVMPPERIFPPHEIPTIPSRANIDCSRGDCFDYTRCPLTGGFPVYLYPINHIRDDAKHRRAENIQAGLRKTLQIVEDANTACIWFFITDSVDVFDPEKLEHWHGDGRNHVILDLSGSSSWADIGRASKMGTGFANVLPFDLLLPEPIELHQPIWEIAPLMTPIKRAHRLVFQFSPPQGGSKIVEQLALLKKQPDNVIEPVSCNAKPWANCGTLEERLEILSTSTFSLVLVENSFADVSDRLLESMLSGAVPVILSYSGLLPLPLDSVIDWSKASLQLPLSRLPELSFMLSSMTSDDIFDLRRQGRFLLEEYFSSEVKSVYSGLQVLRNKIGLTPTPMEQAVGQTTNIEKFYPPTLPAEPNFLDEEAKDEFVSIQSLSPLPSPVFPQNYTYLIKDYFNSVGPFAHKMVDVNILATPLPSEEKFHDKQLPFDPICGGAGGDGTQYQNALGGNFPREEFTVVILTYKRDDVLIGTLSRLVNQPHLNKVVVVWNSPYPIPDNLQWPAIGAPVEVVVPEQNSLNNRFLPYKNIETEAILSLDDDTHLRRDEIEFAFRTWRENRDRIVGFPGRHHSWENGGWFYNSNHTCELSMVLTGAAFFHKQYSYLYSNWQPPEVKALVDELMNCEDIALNFLVSHLTRKPPVKVTSRWTFRCLGCPEALSSTDGHFNERHYCIKKESKDSSPNLTKVDFLALPDRKMTVNLMPSRKSRGQRKSVEPENVQVKSEPEPAETQRKPNYDNLPSEFAICDPNSATPIAPKPPLPSTPKTPQNVQKKPEASKKTENKPKPDRPQQEKKPPKEMKKPTISQAPKENRQNAKNPAKEAVKKQEDRAKRVESQERKSTEDLIKDLMARNEEIGSLMKIIQGNLPNQKTTEKKILKQELKNLSHMQDIYAGNCLSIALRLFNAESSSEKTDKYRVDLYRSIGRFKQKNEEKTAEINAAMSKLSVNNKEAESQKIEKQPKKTKKEYNQGSPKNSKTAEKKPDPVKLKPAQKMAVPEPARKEGSGISSNSRATSESEATEEQIEAMESDPYRVYDEVDALAGQLSECDMIPPGKQYVEPQTFSPSREVSKDMASLKIEEKAASVNDDSHLAQQMDPSEFTEINDDYCQACEDLGEPCEDCDEFAGW